MLSAHLPFAAPAHVALGLMLQHTVNVLALTPQRTLLPSLPPLSKGLAWTSGHSFTCDTHCNGRKMQSEHSEGFHWPLQECWGQFDAVRFTTVSSTQCHCHAVFDCGTLLCCSPQHRTASLHGHRCAVQALCNAYDALTIT